MRKYEISCTIIIQNLAQLKTMYKDSWESITGNCDTFIFLGGQEQTTLKYVSEKLGKETIAYHNSSKTLGKRGSSSKSMNITGRDLMTADEIARMDNGYCISFIRGELPFFTKKYNYPRHKNYKFTGDAKEDQLYNIKENFRTAENLTVVQSISDVQLVEEAKHTDANELRHLIIQKTDIRKETCQGLETMVQKELDVETIEDIGFTSFEPEEVKEVMSVEEGYNPNSDYDDDETDELNF